MLLHPQIAVSLSDSLSILTFEPATLVMLFTHIMTHFTFLEAFLFTLAISVVFLPTHTTHHLNLYSYPTDVSCGPG
jgi:hypothetical protein